MCSLFNSNSTMALLTLTRKLKLPHLTLIFPLASQTKPQFSQTFHQTPLSHPLPTPHQSISSHPSHDPIAFIHHTFQSHPNTHTPPLHKVVDALETSDGSETNAIERLDSLGIEPGCDLVYWGIWVLRDRWKLAFFVFKWGVKWGCCNEKVGSLMVFVLGEHRKFNTAWCVIRDMYMGKIGTRKAMLVLIDRYAAANEPGEAIRTFHLIEKFKLGPDQEAFHTLLNVLCKHGNMEEAEEFMLVNKKLFSLDTEGFNIILNGWCNISVDVFEAKRVWREMSKCCITPDETSYTHMISCFSKVGNLFDSLRLYDEMKKRGWTPGIEVYNSLVYVLTHENCLSEAKKIIVKMKEVGLQPDSVTYNAMIRPLCESNKLEDANTILATMTEDDLIPNTDTYHAFLKALCFEETLEVLRRMKKAGIDPNENTFLLILEKFFRLEQPQNALKIWEEMKHYRVVPDSKLYTTLVEGLVKHGDLDKAREFYAEMRLHGIPDDPKLKKVLEKPAQGNKKWKEVRQGNGNKQRAVGRKMASKRIQYASRKNKI